MFDPTVARQFHDLCNAVWAIQVEVEAALSIDPAGPARPELEEIRVKAAEAMRLLGSATAMHGLSILGRPLPHGTGAGVGHGRLKHR